MDIRLKPEMEEMIRAMIEQGYASARRGELLDFGRVKQEMEQRKSVWIAEKRRSQL